ncbi:hypothetical protein CEV34_2239 [Brucella pseudogrignonensis]|uniref:Uncharacterized protein n=1 Tax=Brucella pseudogrignonensis TaxID=419475 RepID=A0A256GHU8_9HYPH|nr:hypothetical protein CEV34_2239 [Brucella pseudogrignonensis]
MRPHPLEQMQHFCYSPVCAVVVVEGATVRDIRTETPP